MIRLINSFPQGIEIIFPSWYLFVFWRWQDVPAVLLLWQCQVLNVIQVLDSVQPVPNNTADTTSSNIIVYCQLQCSASTPTETFWSSLWASFLRFCKLTMVQQAMTLFSSPLLCFGYISKPARCLWREKGLFYFRLLRKLTCFISNQRLTVLARRYFD